MGCNVLQITEGLSLEFGGTIVVVCQISNHMVRHECRSTVLELVSSGSKNVDLDPRVDLRTATEKTDFSEFDLIHIHGLWHPYHIQVARAARRCSVPVIVSIHGMLEPWALNRSWLKKRFARFLYQDQILKNAACLHTSSDDETNHVRQLNLNPLIAEIPFGVEIPLRIHPSRQTGSMSGIPGEKRMALFLSRLHPKKGLDVLLRSWARVCDRFPDWILAVAGSDENGYRAGLEFLARNLKIEKTVFFLGPVYGEKKEALFGRAELFVLPTYSENFGFVIPEALGWGIPVITTRGTPWKSIAERGCGWWIESGVDELGKTLESALARSSHELRSMGEIGRNYIKECFSTEVFGQSMLQMYQWVTGRKEKQPDFVDSQFR